MAEFKLALDKVLRYEGGYSFDKDDKGLETFRGISRKYHPKWEGWFVIDNERTNNENKNMFIRNIENNQYLEELVENFYKNEFWDKIKGDSIKNQQIAEIIFDTSVNMGLSFAVKKAQELLSCTVDGIVGSKTLQMLNLIKPDRFINDYKTARIIRYFEIVNRHPEQNKFLKGWIKRTISI